METKFLILASLFCLSAFAKHENSLGRGITAPSVGNAEAGLPKGFSAQGGYIPKAANTALATGTPPAAASAGLISSAVAAPAEPKSGAGNAAVGASGGSDKGGYMGGQAKAPAAAGGGGAGAGNAPQQDPEQVENKEKKNQPPQQVQLANGNQNDNGLQNRGAPRAQPVSLPTRAPASVAPQKLTDQQFVDELTRAKTLIGEGKREAAQAILDSLKGAAQPGNQQKALEAISENPKILEGEPATNPESEGLPVPSDDLTV